MTLVMNGIDRIHEYSSLFNGKRLGLITAPTGTNRDLISTIDILFSKHHLTALFSPEHGVRGNTMSGAISTYTDSATGLPVFSLFGERNRPTPEMLANVDAIVYDVQDIGARSYTFISTMYYAMEESARHGKEFIVLDRVNPVGGLDVEGNMLNPAYRSFVGVVPIAMRHGMTVGELARFMNEEYEIGCALEVVPMSGWRRSMYYGDTDLQWIGTSPNVPDPDAALLYSSFHFLAATPVSFGRGTTQPFKLIGAPWLDADRLATALNGYGLPGVRFRPAYFNPMFNTGNLYGGELCRGVQVHLTDRKAFRAIETGIRTLFTIREQSGNHFHWRAAGQNCFRIDLFAGSDELRRDHIDVDALLEDWERQARIFDRQRTPYLLYD